MSNNNLPDNLKALRKSLGSLTQTQFGKAMGMSKASVAGVETGRNKLTFDQLLTAHKVFNVDPVYLLSGEGEMFRRPKERPFLEISTVEEPKRPYLIKGTPLVTIAAYASYSTGDQTRHDLPIVRIPGLQDEETRVFEVSGDSMEPLLLHGDFIACTKLQAASQLRSGLIYVVVSADHGVSVKYVRQTVNAIRCLSHSPDHDAYNIPLEDVLELWEVQVRITRNLLGTGMTSQPVNEASNVQVERVENALNQLLNIVKHPPKGSL